MTIRRNVDQALWVTDALQLTARHGGTPATWKQGRDVIIAASAPVGDATDILRGMNPTRIFAHQSAATERWTGALWRVLTRCTSAAQVEYSLPLMAVFGSSPCHFAIAMQGVSGAGHSVIARRTRS
jgi:hypothetical protein